MKLCKETRERLIAMLNAESGVEKMLDADYKNAILEVGNYLNSDGIRHTGGIKPEIYEDNKTSKKLKEAVKTHIKVAERALEKKPSKKKPSKKKDKDMAMV